MTLWMALLIGSFTAVGLSRRSDATKYALVVIAIVVVIGFEAVRLRAI